MNRLSTKNAKSIFERDGYVIVRNLIPSELTDRARAFLEREVLGPDQQGQYPLPVRMAPIWQLMAQWMAGDSLLFRLLDTKGLYCHWPPMVRCVMPRNSDALWPCHADTQYNDHITGDFLTVWIPLVPIDGYCGGLTVWGNDHVTEPLLDPGDAIILSKDCEHQSEPNVSNRPRLSVDYRFFGDSASSTKHYLDMANGIVMEPVHV